MGIRIQLTIKNELSGASTSPLQLPEEVDLQTEWGEIRELIGRDHDGIVSYKINDVSVVNVDDLTPLRDLLGTDTSPEEIQIEAISSLEPTRTSLMGTSDSPYFVPDTREEARRESSKYLTKILLPDGSVRKISGHSFERLEDGGEFVDQLATSSVKYVVEGINDRGEQVTVELSSQQCILVDKGDPNYDPYILVSNSARKALDSIQPIGFLTVNVDRDGQDTVPRVNLLARLRAAERNLLLRFRESIANGFLTRISAYLSSLVFRYFPLALFAVLTDYASPPILLMMALFVLSSHSMVTQLEEIIRQDLPVRLKPYLMRFVNFLKFVSRSLDRLNLNGLGTWVVDFGIGNDRPHLSAERRPEEEQHGVNGVAVKVWKVLKVIFQDLVLALSTLLPSFFSIYSYEMVRKRAEAERVEAEIAQRNGAANADDLPNEGEPLNADLGQLGQADQVVQDVQDAELPDGIPAHE
ncbi:DEKNAAC104242 [Brettanomyces naardenensis]|uniref:DEKNAAC104242 n=1 Tax=Brettanomyces naardenensis TaxID=13370 RepID=A0A448YPU7_BRENA|nr:DEKNAAC104242 [Brettanomyces naardenensis]